MNKHPHSPSSSTTFWLLLLGASALVSVVFLIHTFRQALIVPDNQPATAPQAAAEATEADTAPAPAAWSRQLATRVQPAQPAESAPPVKLTPAEEEAARREMIRDQAAYLRRQSAANTDPDGVNKLTAEQIAELEKKGVMAW